MSGRRRGPRYDSLSPEPIIIERKPRNTTPSPPPRRRVSFVSAVNPFKRDKQTVFIKESTIRRRRTHRPSRSRSTSPSPPRGPNHIMDPRLGDNYVPLPKKLPLKDERSSSSEGDKDKKGKRRKPKIIHGPHPEDERAFPVIESPGSNQSPRRRDSGVGSIEGSPHARPYFDEFGRPTFGPSYSHGAVGASERLHAELMKERLDRIEAEKVAMRAREQANEAKAEATEAKAELERLKRSSWLDDRERKISDREKQYDEQHRRITDVPRPAREVVLSQPRPPVRFVDEATDALNRARDDLKRRSGGGR